MCMPWLSGQKGSFLPDMHAWLRDGKVTLSPSHPLIAVWFSPNVCFTPVWFSPNVCFAQVRVVECFFEGLEQWPAGCNLFVHVSSVSLMRAQHSRRCLQAPTMARWSCVCSCDGWPQPGPAEAPPETSKE